MASKRNFSPANLLIGFGILFFLAAFSIVAFTFFPIAKEEASYQIHEVISQGKTAEIPPVDTDFGIVIEKIGANAKVIPNVNPFDSREYQQALSRGVAHAKGSALPGEPGNIFLFSHSSTDFWQATRYNSVFYLLDKLEKGDKIILYYKENKFVYSVQLKKIVGSDEVSYLKNSTTEKKLTLMTCWPPGTSLKRLIIEATIQSDTNM